MTRAFIDGGDWLPESEFSEMFHWPLSDYAKLGIVEECSHERLPGDRGWCACWGEVAAA